MVFRITKLSMSEAIVCKVLIHNLEITKQNPKKITFTLGVKGLWPIGIQVFIHKHFALCVLEFFLASVLRTVQKTNINFNENLITLLHNLSAFICHKKKKKRIKIKFKNFQQRK